MDHANVLFYCCFCLFVCVRPTTVHRFVTQGTVEEHIYEWTRKERQEQDAEEAVLE